MRKVLVLSLGLFLLSLTASFSQGLMDYVKEVKGDTLVIKDYIDMGLQPNSLNNAVLGDSVNNPVPAGRVYQLQTNGWYPQSAGLTTPSNRAVEISGADKTILVNNNNAATIPPIISGYNDESGSYVGGITWGNDLTVKNISQIIGSPDGVGGWAFYGTGAPDRRIVFDNCMMEHNWWVFIQSNGNPGNSFFITNSYFVNLSGRACRRNGGVYDNVNNNTDTMYVENNTHVMGQGMMYKFRNYPVEFIYFNHNTFVNCVGSTFETQGVQSKMIVTNNIFVNSNCQPFRPNMTEDLSEQDIDNMPAGIINVAALPATMDQVPRKFLVDKNVAYWDARLADLGTEANNLAINGFTTWTKQSMTMNDRTQGFFNDNATYPFLTEGQWYDKLPSFADTRDLLTAQVDACKAFCLSTVDTTSTQVLAPWRVVNATMPDDFIYSDWPIPIDLSYTDADLLGTDGLPVGDLNWFPTQKATYNANKATYYAALLDGLENGHLVSDVEVINSNIPETFELSQNYPNPFNPATVINFAVPKAGNVTLKVYNSLGQEVATLVNGYKEAQSYKVTFDASNLASGVYIYKLESANLSISKKMLLLK
ncbi:MAG: T9SS type A sorting domain-containing protein [bacterium]